MAGALLKIGVENIECKEVGCKADDFLRLRG
jgi:hypothetical protein